MNNILQEANKDMMEGIEICAKLIRPTFGGAGTSVIVESNLRPGHQIVNDCETIIQAVKITDNPAQKIALNLLKELCSKQDKVAGNARKTTILMAIEILKGVFVSSPNQAELSKLKEELDALIPFIESEIDKRTTKITVDNILGVATTASRNKETGKLLQEIYPQIGASGILNIEGSKTYETSYKITNGVRFEFTGMLSPEMVHDEEAAKENRKETKAIYYNPIILVTKKKITTDEDINPLLKEMELMEKKDLVIFTNDMDSGVASLLVNLHKSKQFNILIIKAPSLWQDYIFEDFAKCVGAIIVEDKSGVSFKNLDPKKHLGTCERIEVDQEDTVLTGIQDITEHMKALQDKGDDDSLLRLSWLAAKSAVLKLGANSQTDLSYKRLKANDANRSTYLALQYGVVLGGAISLYEVSMELPKTMAGKILRKALQVPASQAKANYGIRNSFFRFFSGQKSYESIITSDIVDASQTIKMAVRNAIGIASTVITAPSIVYLPKKTPEEIAYETAMRSSNPFNQ